MSHALNSDASAAGLALVCKTAMALPAKVLAVLAQRRQAARTAAALEGLSDRTLADIGISRSDIPRIARDGCETVRF